MLLQTEGDLIVLLALAAAVLLGLLLMAAVVAIRRTLQVKQFQDLLFKAERKIDNLERRMFNVLNAVPVALMETDATGRLTFANRTAHQLLGRKDNELIGLRFHSATWGITYPDGRMIPPDLLPIARTLRGQTVRGFQHLIVNHDSRSKILVSVTSMPIVNTIGEVIGATTALVELETTSGEGIGDLSGVWRGHWFTAAPVAFFGLSPDAMVLDLNAAACELFDLTREEALGQDWSGRFVSSDDGRKATDYLSGLERETGSNLEAEKPRFITLSLRAPGGLTRETLVSGWIVHTQDGAERGITIMALPMFTTAPAPLAAPLLPSLALSDEDTEALRELRQAETARAALGVGVWYYDAEADAIVEDEGMRRLIGRETPDGPSLISEDGQAEAEDAFNRLVSGDTDHFELELEVGETRRIALKGQALTLEEGRRLFGVVLDITDLQPPEAEAPPPPEPTPYEETLEYLNLKTRLGALEYEIEALQQANAEAQAREARLDEALAEARRYEAAGRLSSRVSSDFTEMLEVMNAALEMIGRKTPDTDLKRLSDAALAAGRRGERLTAQLQALIPQDEADRPET